MNALLGVAGLLFVATITPGPNNLIVMREAARAGWSAAFSASVGVVAGSVALLTLVIVGVGSAVDREPRLAVAIAVAGCLYLSLLGGRLIAGSFSPRPRAVARPGTRRAAGAAGLFAFQFANPKAWITTSTVVAAAESHAGAGSTLPLLIVLYLLISTPSLMIWSSCGALMTGHLERRSFRSWFDRTAGALLLGSALLLISGI